MAASACPPGSGSGSGSGIALVSPAMADVIYSNLQNIAIPATYDGVYLNVENGIWNTDMFNPVAGWDINPFFAGLVLTNNTGNVLQSAAVDNAQTVTLNSAAGSFTLGSAITNTGGNTNSVLKTGAGTTTLTGTHTYTGATTIHQGTLALGATGSIANSTTLIVGDVGSSGAVLDVSALSGGFTVDDAQTLGGTGSITGAVIMDGILSPGASIESLSSGALTFNSGSTFAYEMDSGLDPSVAADL